MKTEYNHYPNCASALSGVLEDVPCNCRAIKVEIGKLADKMEKEWIEECSPGSMERRPTFIIRKLAELFVTKEPR